MSYLVSKFCCIKIQINAVNQMLVEIPNDWLFLIFIQQTQHSNIVCCFTHALIIFMVLILPCVFLHSQKTFM